MLIAFLAALAWMLPAMALDADEAEEADTYLVVSSHGYSRFEFSGNDVVVFYTDGVEFRYLDIELTAENLRFNKATQEAVIDGDVTGRFGETRFGCHNLYLDGAHGLMEISEGVSLENNKLGIVLDCSFVKANFPPGATELQLADMLIDAGGGVQVTTGEGHVITCPGLIFTGEDMVASTSGRVVLKLADKVVTLRDAAFDMSGMTIDADGILCRFSPDNEPAVLEIQHVTGVSDGLNFSARRLTAVTDDTGGSSAELWDVTMDNLVGEIELEQGWMNCTAEQAHSVISDFSISSVELRDSVEVVSSTGAFVTEQAEAVLTDTGYRFILPDDVTISFNLAAIGGQDPVDFHLLGAE